MAPETNLDDVVAALARRRRRYALYCLRDEEFLELEDLARQVVAWRTDRSPEAVREEDLERVVLEIQHNDLEVFRQVGCVEYDDRSGVVRYRDPPDVLVALLDVVADAEHPDRG